MTQKGSDLRARLAGEIGPSFASDLQAHLVRGAVFVVDGALALLDVAEAIAEDDTMKVEAWIAASQLRRPSSAQMKRWHENPHFAFQTVVVSPYVLAQEQTEG